MSERKEKGWARHEADDHYDCSVGDLYALAKRLADDLYGEHERHHEGSKCNLLDDARHAGLLEPSGDAGQGGTR